MTIVYIWLAVLTVWLFVLTFAGIVTLGFADDNEWALKKGYPEKERHRVTAKVRTTRKLEPFTIEDDQ